MTTSYPIKRDPAIGFHTFLESEGMTPKVIDRFRKIIHTFYRNNGRDLPWRHTTNPYHILVSEVMLQQTQVERVVRKYPEFISAFPSSTALANAPLHKILTVWQGMGYNRRAIALQKCARRMVDEFGGILPEDSEILASFPGIGKATVRSIRVFAFNKPEIFIETNIRRVFIHFFFADFQGIHDRDILPLVKSTLDPCCPRAWYSGLMDYGTMLKTIVPNPNRRSAHYSKQPTFEGSDRQVRGTVIRLLLKNPQMGRDDLVMKTGQDPSRIRRIVRSLEYEGFLIQSGDGIILADNTTRKSPYN